MAILSLMSKGEAQSSSSLFFNDFVGTKMILFSKNEDSTYMSHAIGELYFQKYNFFVKYIVWGFHKDGEKLFPMNICFVKSRPGQAEQMDQTLRMIQLCGWWCPKVAEFVISLVVYHLLNLMLAKRSKWGASGVWG